MAKSPVSKQTRPVTQSPECFSAPYLICLLHEVQTMLQKAREQETVRGMDQAVSNLKQYISGRLIAFYQHISKGESKDQRILEKLWGYETGYPMKYVATAQALSISIDDVAQVETRCVVAMTTQSRAIVNELQTDWLKNHPCPGCPARYNDFHNAGCIHEECPFCHECLSNCFCAYTNLKIRYGGQSRKEWEKIRKLEGSHFNPRKHARPLTMEERRTWENIVFQKGCIAYGHEMRFK